MTLNSREKGKRPVVGPCIEHNQKGKYARVWYNGGLESQHVAVYLRQHGPDSIPDGYEIDHLCSNCRCINVDHLEAVTKVENVRRSRATKLTKEQVRTIRRLAADELMRRKRDGKSRRSLGWQVAMGSLYGVTPDNIKQIVRRASWRDV